MLARGAAGDATVKGAPAAELADVLDSRRCGRPFLIALPHFEESLEVFRHVTARLGSIERSWLLKKSDNRMVKSYFRELPE